MPNKIRSQKLSFQYFYLCLDLEETTELCFQANEDMQKFMKEKYPDYYKVMHAPRPQGDPENKKEKQEDENINEDGDANIEGEENKGKDEEDFAGIEGDTKSIPKNKDLKKLYRKIAERTHPDKVGNDKYASVFSAAAQAYASNNLAEILKICGNMNIEIIELCPESIALLKDNIKEISEAIYHKKQTAAWVWTEAKNEQQKRELIEKILQHHGIIK
jgi:hypothetical protein